MGVAGLAAGWDNVWLCPASSLQRFDDLGAVAASSVNFNRRPTNRLSITAIGNESVPKVIISDTINLFLNCNQHCANFKP